MYTSMCIYTFIPYLSIVWSSWPVCAPWVFVFFCFFVFVCVYSVYTRKFVYTPLSIVAAGVVQLTCLCSVQPLQPPSSPPPASAEERGRDRRRACAGIATTVEPGTQPIKHRTDSYVNSPGDILLLQSFQTTHFLAPKGDLTKLGSVEDNFHTSHDQPLTNKNLSINLN